MTRAEARVIYANPDHPAHFTAYRVLMEDAPPDVRSTTMGGSRA